MCSIRPVEVPPPVDLIAQKAKFDVYMWVGQAFNLKDKSDFYKSCLKGQIHHQNDLGPKWT